MAKASILTWSPEMTVGVAGLDNQHKALIGEIKRLQAAGKAHDRDAVENCLAALATYAVKHFHDEESYMVKIHYGRIEDHRRLHDDFTNKVQFLIARMRQDRESPTSKEVLDFLSAWWTEHIRHEDKDYARDVAY